jgi:hypothetical protein
MDNIAQIFTFSIGLVAILIFALVALVRGSQFFAIEFLRAFRQVRKECAELETERIQKLELLRETVADLGPEYLEEQYPKLAKALKACDT